MRVKAMYDFAQIITTTRFIDPHISIVKDEDMCIRYYKGSPHSINDEPAVEYYSYQQKRWCKQGKLHLIGGPAIEGKDGCKKWYQNDKLHRIDGPAIESNTNKEWYQNGLLHRTDGPADEWHKGRDWTYKWYQNGKLHRIDGPAIEVSDGEKYWYQNGNRIQPKKVILG